MLLSKLCLVHFAMSSVLVCLAGCNSTSVEKPVGKLLSSKQLSTVVGTWIDPNGDEIRIESDGNGDFVIGRLEFEHDSHTFAVFSSVLAIRSLGKLNLVFIKNPSGQDFFFGRIVDWDDKSVVIHPSTDRVFRNAVRDKVLKGKEIAESNVQQRVVLSADEGSLEAFIGARTEELCFSKDNQIKLLRRQAK